ncbi:MAG: LiaF-related protein, partial [Chloroflexota bacterium]|nr:LiaF-related protein [Chloroflexota bacterium]
LSVLIIFGILLGMLWMAGVGITPLGEQPLTSENINQPLGDANRAEIILAPSVGILSLGTLSGSEALIAGEVSTGRGQEVCSDYDIQAHTATYSLRAQNSVPVPARAWDWDLALGGTVPVDLDVSMGVGKIDLDLESVKTPNLNISQGIGEIDVIISERSSTDAEISQAIGSITIRIPQGVAVRLSTSKAISSLQLPSNFEQRGEYYFSPNYETSNERVTLEISQAIGSIMVKYENK